MLYVYIYSMYVLNKYQISVFFHACLASLPNLTFTNTSLHQPAPKHSNSVAAHDAIAWHPRRKISRLYIHLPTHLCILKKRATEDIT